MNAAELREALDRNRLPIPKAIEDAARNIALPILEADPELVERVAAVIERYDGIDPDRVFTNAILAALSTPTPGAE